jgi:hypothetical protein
LHDVNLSVKPIHVQRLSTGSTACRQFLSGNYLAADPELDSDFLGADFSATGFAGALVEVDGAGEVEGVEVVDDPESDFGVLVEAELSEARESVR